MLRNIELLFLPLLRELLPCRISHASEPWNSFDRIQRQMVAIYIVGRAHIERSSDRSLLLIAAHMNVIVIPAPVGETMNNGA